MRNLNFSWENSFIVSYNAVSCLKLQLQKEKELNKIMEISVGRNKDKEMLCRKGGELDFVGYLEWIKEMGEPSGLGAQQEGGQMVRMNTVSETNRENAMPPMRVEPRD